MIRHWFQAAIQTAQRVLSRRWLGVAVMGLSFAMMGIILLRDAQSLQVYANWSDYLGVCAIGFLLYLLPLLAHLGVWSGLMRSLGQVLEIWWNVEVFAYSHLLRRLPGALWYVVGRTAMYRARGVAVNVPIVASGLEWLLIVLAGLIVFVVLSVLEIVGPVISGVLFIAALVLTAITLQMLLRAGAWVHLPGRLGMWQIRATSFSQLLVRDLIIWLSLYSFAYAIGGLILFLLARSIEPLAAIDIGFAIRAWALTGGFGILISLVVPIGMGVRELTLAALLSMYMTPSAAVLVSILLRILFTVADIVWGGSLLVLARLVNRGQATASINPP
jgi:glycosyltransferase 2 family protein